MNELSKINPVEFGLNEAEVQTIEQAFMPKIVERDGLKKVYEELITGELTKELTIEAKSLRNKLVKVRTGIADIHKTQKAFFLAAGRYVDAWKNKETEPVLQMEEKLEEIETHFIRIEQERIRKIESERRERILQYTEVMPAALGLMDENVFENYLTGVKFAYDEKIAAEKKSEEERLAKIEADRIENERIRKENERLMNEAIERDRLAEIERKKQADILKAQQEKADKERREQELKLEAERKEKQRIENELKAKQEAENKAKQAEQERLIAEEKQRRDAERKAKNAPDKEKLLILAYKISGIVFPDLKTNEAIEILNNVNLLLFKVNAYIKEKAAEL